MRRRTFLRLVALSGAALAHGPGSAAVAAERGRARGAAVNVGLYGHWVARTGVPAFVYDADQDALPAAEWDPILSPRTRRHWLMIGNRAIRLQGANDGTVAVFDERYGLRWLVAPEPSGSGVSLLDDDAGKQWGSAFDTRAGETPPLR